MKFKLIGSIGACIYIYDEKRGFRSLKVSHFLGMSFTNTK